MEVRAVVLGLAMATLSFAIPAAAQDRPAGDREGGDRKVERDSKEGRFSDRDRRADWQKGEQALEQALKLGQDKAFYRKELEKQGYKVTATNYDKPDYLEYEVVKGDQSYEVQISFDKNNRKANKIDVTTNMWQAEATERALESAKGRAAETPKGRPS
jgi:hypothetical protein